MAERVNDSRDTVSKRMQARIQYGVVPRYYTTVMGPPSLTCQSVAVYAMLKSLFHIFLVCDGTVLQRIQVCKACNNFSERERHVRYMLSPVRLSSVCLSVCLSSVTFVRPTQAVRIFGNISTALGTLAIR